MKSNLATIIKKELSRFFMDRKLLLTTVIMPGLMIYIIYSLMGITAIIVTDVALYTLFNIALNSKIKTVNA